MYLRITINAPDNSVSCQKVDRDIYEMNHSQVIVTLICPFITGYTVKAGMLK